MKKMITWLKTLCGTLSKGVLKSMYTMQIIWRKIHLIFTVFFHKIKCRYWNWRIPADINLYIQRWQAIDHRKDHSVTGKDFRFWYYMRKVE